MFEKTSIIIFKELKHDFGPSYLNDLLQNFFQVHSKELRGAKIDLHFPRRKRGNGQKSLSHQG